jgi:hypothetical protein
MSGQQTSQRLTRETLEEHRQIHFYLDQIAQTLARLDPVPPDVEPMRRLAAQLQGLRERLLEHQQSEEGGVFPAMLEVLPACRVEIDRLINQHDRMIEILEMARIHAERSEPGEAEDLRRDLEGFLELFRQHEAAEERLLDRALSVDAPAAD